MDLIVHGRSAPSNLSWRLDIGWGAGPAWRGAGLGLLGLAALVTGCTGDGDSSGAPPGVPCDQPDAVQDCFPGAPTARAVGSCQVGESRCVDGVWTECTGYVLPTAELCEGDGDENCNGVINDGCSCAADDTPQACYGGPAATRAIGICREGVQRCVTGSWSTDCEGDVLPQEEGCNLVDDDCDGAIDEGCSCTDGTIQSCYAGPAGTAELGICRAGEQSCVDGTWSQECAGQVLPAAETCNGVDDDCDGVTDDGDPGGGVACLTSQPGVCADGIRHCVAGASTCVAIASPTPENCDGRDENCNGVIDDGTFLPPAYDAFEWIPPGWFGLPPGALVVWGSHCALWDEASGNVTLVTDLADAWDAFGPNGTQPPTSGISAVIALPAGLFGGGTDSLWVASGTNFYAITAGSNVWQTATILSSLGVTDRVDAMTAFFAGEIPGFTDPTLFVVRQNQTWLYSASTGWTAPMDTTLAFCLPGSTGSCPPAVGSLSRIPGNPAGILVGSGTQTWTSPWRTCPEGLCYAWTPGTMSAVSCAQD